MITWQKICHFSRFVIRSGGYSQLPLRNCICSEIHHKLLSAGQCRKVYYPDLDTRSYWYLR